MRVEPLNRSWLQYQMNIWLVWLVVITEWRASDTGDDGVERSRCDRNITQLVRESISSGTPSSWLSQSKHPTISEISAVSRPLVPGVEFSPGGREQNSIYHHRYFYFADAVTLLRCDPHSNPTSARLIIPSPRIQLRAATVRSCPQFFIGLRMLLQVVPRNFPLGPGESRGYKSHHRSSLPPTVENRNTQGSEQRPRGKNNNPNPTKN